jgi:CRISPR-associated protein Csd1
MLVQALADFADTYLPDQLQDESCEDKPVPYLVELDRTGTFLNITPRLAFVARGRNSIELAVPLSVPRSPVPRNSGLYPLLAADDIKYVLGVGAWTKSDQEENHRERHQAFIELIGNAALQTGDEALAACERFYARPDETEKARKALAAAKPGTIVALSVDGPVTSRAAVRAYWRQHYASATANRVGKAGTGECLISGRRGPIAPTHEKIKHVAGIGGQGAGVSLMSFDKDAFCSYGWEQNANSPTAPDRAMAYVLALNHLLHPGGKHRLDIAKVAFVYWTKEQTEDDPMSAIWQADESQVKALLQLDPGANPDPNMFYMAGLGANGGRLLVRYWVAETLGRMKANQKSWFEQLRIADLFNGGFAPVPKLWQLQNAIHRTGAPPKNWVIALIRRAIEGPDQPLGYEILSAALARLRIASENRKDTARVGLIRLCINDLTRHQGVHMPPQLDEGPQEAAYLCGRLLAVYESLQYQAHGREVNQTVADRYYALASTYPALAFPKLEDLGQKHLRKLRRPETFGTAVNISKEIDQLCLAIENAAGFRFPGGLDLIGQGRFALGYHHQRAHQFEQARNRKSQESE